MLPLARNDLLRVADPRLGAVVLERHEVEVDDRLRPAGEGSA